jgi:antitoxin HicB
MRYAYPCLLDPETQGGFIAYFPNVPEALTGGSTETETLGLAADALAVALAGYVLDKRDIPTPSATPPGGHLVSVPPVTAAKLALYATMRRDNVSKVALAQRLNLSESAIRKLLDPDHRSHIGQVETALRMLGRTLVVEDKAA